MTPWADIALSAVADTTGILTQLYPASCTAGTGAQTLGNLIRKPSEGFLTNLQVEPDGTNGGEIEIWDINGADGGADVNTSTVITAAQLAAAIALGKARILYSQKFSGSSGSRLAIAHGVPFMHGLAGRYINAGATGTCELNITADGGFIKTQLIV